MGVNMQMSIFSQEDSHVNHSVMPGSEKACRMTATSGQKCYESFVKLGLGSSWAKTFMASLLGTKGWFSTRCYLTWKLQGTKRSRWLFRLVPSMPRTDETGFGLLPTMTVQDANGRSYHYQRGDKTKQVPSLLGTARLWPTPRATDWKDGRGKTGNRSEEAAAKAGWTLSEKVKLLPTPTAQDAKNATLPPSQQERDSIPGRLLRDGHSGALNPQWVEWLMGYPSGWTDLEPSETR